MRLNEAISAAKEQLQSILHLEITNVIAASKKDDGWHVTIELVERKAVPDTQDLLGTYDVLLDDTGDVMSYDRKKLHRRMDLEETVE